jgi:hypothetical protein
LVVVYTQHSLSLGWMLFNIFSELAHVFGGKIPL